MEYQKKTIELLKQGYTINDIAEYLKINNFETNSLSSVEKYIRKLKKEYQAKTMFQLGFLISNNSKND